jgi:hypothetical protein
VVAGQIIIKKDNCEFRTREVITQILNAFYLSYLDLFMLYSIQAKQSFKREREFENKKNSKIVNRFTGKLKDTRIYL